MKPTKCPQCGGKVEVLDNVTDFMGLPRKPTRCVYARWKHADGWWEDSGVCVRDPKRSAKGCDRCQLSAAFHECPEAA